MILDHKGAADVFSQWDVVHFTAIAGSGYQELTQAAFFPGLPLLMAFFQLVGVPPILTGMLASLLASGLAAWALYRLTGGGVAGTVAAIVWSFAPMAVFGFVAYTEAPFCAFAFWAWFQARKGNWGLAAGLAAGACLFRVSGLFLIGALGLLALIGFTGSSWGARLRRIAWLLIPTAVSAAYTVYLKVVFGSWTSWFEAQSEGWARAFHWPWEAWATTWRVIMPGSGYEAQAGIFRWEIAAIVIGVIVTVVAFRRHRAPEASWVGIQVLAFSCQVWFFSVARSMLGWFPLFSSIGEFSVAAADGRRRVAIRGVLGVVFLVEIFAMVWWALRFFTGAWAG